MNSKTIAVLGLSGRTGQILGKMLLDKKYKIKALVRNSNRLKISHPNLEIFEGNVENVYDLEKLTTNADAVVSVMGYSKNSPDFFQTKCIKKIIPLLEKSNCKKLILLTGSGVPFDNDVNTMGNKFLSFIIKKIAKIRFQDGVLQVEELKKSSLNWTVFRCPLLKNNLEIERNTYVGNRAPGLLNTINRGTVCHLIINEIEENKHQRMALFAWN